MDIQKYIRNSLFKLRLMGIESRVDEREMIDGFLQMPREILNDMEPAQILGMILDNVGAAQYDGESGRISLSSRQLYSFDMEVFDTSTMYTVFLNALNELSDGELVFADIREGTDGEAYSAGVGTQTVAFTLNGQRCRFDVQVNYDWFDTEIIGYINQLLQKQPVTKALYGTSDGFQNCILFYTTDQWAEGFNVNFPELPIVRV